MALYARTAYRTAGPGDSAEYLIAMTTWGVPHAPGYPLLCLIGNLCTSIVGRGNAPAVLNLLNAAFAAGAAAFVTLAVAVLGAPWWAGAIAALALGTARTFWTQALAVEVVSLNALVAAILLFLFAFFLAERERGRRADWTLVCGAAALTTAVTHHATIVLLGIPIAIVSAWIAFAGRRAPGIGGGRTPLALRIALVLVVGMLPLLYLPLAASHDPPLNWGDPTTLPAMLHSLLRRDFGIGVLIAPSITAGEILQHGESADPSGGKHMGLLLSGMPGQLGWMLVLCAVVAAIGSARKRQPLFVVTVLFAVGQLLFFNRVNTPLTRLYLDATERFHVLPQTFVAFMGGIGLAVVAGRLGSRLRIAGVAAAVAVAVESIAVHVAQLPARDMHRNTFTRDLGINFLAGVPPHALAFTDGDLFRSGALLAQTNAGVRRDVTLVDVTMMGARWYVAQLRRRHSMELPDTMTMYSGAPGTGAGSWLDLNLRRSDGSGRPVVALRMPDDTWKPEYRQRTMGLWFEFRRRDEVLDLRDWGERFSGIVASWRVESIASDYPPNSWEGTQSVFYRYALGCLRAVRDISDAYAPADSSRIPAPALEIADRWRGPDRADFLAYQADQWRSCLEDSLVPSGNASRALAIDRASRLAEESLGIDSTNVQALQTLAWLRGAQGDIAAEVRLRHRIVRSRPGDVGELIDYFTSLAKAKRGQLPEYPKMLTQAEEVRVRAVSVLRMAEAHLPDERLSRFREQLAVPFSP